MLSAAHVLAMDSKNLLDVIDSIRIRCPDVEDILVKRGDVSQNKINTGAAGASTTGPS